MRTNHLPKHLNSSKAYSRRSVLTSLGALTITHSLVSLAEKRIASPKAKEQFVYVGTYTGAVGNGGSGEGIYLYTMNVETGELSLVKLAARADSPSWLAVHPSQRFLYSTNEVTDFTGSHGKGGSVSAYEIDPKSGDLRFLNKVSSEGPGPTHLSVDRSGRYVLVANYDGGSVAVLPILTGGELGTATDFHQDTGSIGPRQSANAPQPNFAISGHNGPHAHMIQPSLDNRFVLYTDLGQDRISISRFDTDAGKLTPSVNMTYAPLPPGDGPRHFAFHPNGHWLYSIQEEASTVVFFHYDSETGELASKQTISALPKGFHGTSFASAILVSPDGRFLYAANRLHDTIAIFAIDATGHLSPVGEISTLGDYPTCLSIDPNGRFLYACDLRSDCIVCFQINSKTGMLSFSGNYTGSGSPNSVVFIS